MTEERFELIDQSILKYEDFIDRYAYDVDPKPVYRFDVPGIWGVLLEITEARRIANE